MTKNKKKFDAVKTMREIRDRLSDRFKDMSFEEEKCYIRERINARIKEKSRNMKSGIQAA